MEALVSRGVREVIDLRTEREERGFAEAARTAELGARYVSIPFGGPVPLTDAVLTAADCVLIVTGHSQYDYQRIVQHAQLVFDACNATKGIDVGHNAVFKIGTAPRPARINKRRPRDSSFPAVS